MDEFKCNLIVYGLDPNGLKSGLHKSTSQYNLPINSLGRKLKSGYIGKPKYALQIAFRCVFFNANLTICDILFSVY